MILNLQQKFHILEYSNLPGIQKAHRSMLLAFHTSVLLLIFLSVQAWANSWTYSSSSILLRSNAWTKRKTTRGNTCWKLAMTHLIANRTPTTNSFSTSGSEKRWKSTPWASKDWRAGRIQRRSIFVCMWTKKGGHEAVPHLAIVARWCLSVWRMGFMDVDDHKPEALLELSAEVRVRCC